MSTLSYIEATWLAVVLIGAGIHVFGLIEAQTDLGIVARQSVPDEARQIVARMRRRHEAVSLGVQLVFSVVGFVAATFPSSRQTIISYISAALFIASAGALVMNSLLDWRSRQLLRGFVPSRRLSGQEGEAEPG